MATGTLIVHLSAHEFDQIESKMSEDERSDPIFFPEHLHVLREKLDSNRKLSSGRSVGALPGKSRRSEHSRAASGQCKLCKPSSYNAYIGFRLTCNTDSRPPVVPAEQQAELVTKLQQMEHSNGAMMRQVCPHNVCLWWA